MNVALQPTPRACAASRPLIARHALIERGCELDALSGAVGELANQVGGVVTIEAPAGLGKTTLVEHTAALAAAADCRVLRAAPGPLERHFPYGVLRALLESPLREAPPEVRVHLLEGAAALAGELLLQGTAPGADATMRVAHSVLWLCSALAEEQPLALVVDDAHWADRPSLEVLAYLARRAGDLPLLLLVASRRDDPDAPADLLSLLADAPAVSVLQPRPLTPAGATRLIRRLAPDTPMHFCRNLHESAHGNPWLLGELGRQAAEHGLTEPIPATLPISDIARGVVRRRLAALTGEERTVINAFAIVGTCAELAAEVSQVSHQQLGLARDGLVAAGLLAPQGNRLAHALIGTAIRDDLPRGERERLHRAAAHALAARGSTRSAIASHLLECEPQGDPAVSGHLRDAATEAWRQGTPHAAVAYLERAVEERAPGDPRASMLAMLATVSFDAGLPDARARLHQALREETDRASRIDVLTRLATLEVVDPGDEKLHSLLERERADGHDAVLELRLDAAALDMLLMLPERHEERARRIRDLTVPADAPTLLRRIVLAHRVCLAMEHGTPGADAAADMALEALEGDELLAEARQRSAFHLCTRALIFTDRVDDATRTIARMREDATARGSMRLEAGAAWYSALLALRTGRVADAENEARLALGLANEPLNMFSGGAIEVLVSALAERGAFDEADELLASHGLDGDIGSRLWEIGILHSRARLGLARGDFDSALADGLAAGELRDRQGRPNPTLTPWRSTVSLALAHSGRRLEAVVPADAELTLAEAFGAPLPILTALHARLLAEDDPVARLALCEGALRVAASAPPSLDAIRVRIEQGTTLRRLERRVEAREPLQLALAEADAVGATLAAQRARRELVATGLRPRRAQREGTEALTPRQRQIAELAAAGTPNRAIAQQLFLSVKTVETHLAGGFRKLGVETRAELERAL